MEKFAIELVKGDNSTILETFDINSKDAAIKAGLEYRKKYTMEQGLICCISAQFDEDENMIDGKSRLYEAW